MVARERGASARASYSTTASNGIFLYFSVCSSACIWVCVSAIQPRQGWGLCLPDAAGCTCGYSNCSPSGNSSAVIKCTNSQPLGPRDLGHDAQAIAPPHAARSLWRNASVQSRLTRRKRKDTWPGFTGLTRCTKYYMGGAYPDYILSILLIVSKRETTLEHVFLTIQE